MIMPRDRISIQREAELTADYDMGGRWGDKLWWCDVTEFKHREYTEGTLFSITGFKPVIPKVGETLICEFKKSWMVFEFVEVHRYTNPRDMFAAKVRIIAQEVK